MQNVSNALSRECRRSPMRAAALVWAALRQKRTFAYDRKADACPAGCPLTSDQIGELPIHGVRTRSTVAQESLITAVLFSPIRHPSYYHYFGRSSGCIGRC